MFNLNQAVGEWRQRLAAGGIKSSEVLDELENHLRDDVEEQVGSGADLEKAFDAAVRRMGPAKTLVKEFAKSDAPVGNLRRTFLRIFYFCCTAAAILIEAWTLITFELSPLQRVTGACAFALFALYLLCLPFLRWWRLGVSQPRLVGLMKAAGIIVPLWTFWALLTALRVIHVEIDIIPAMVMWSLCVAYGLTALACGFQSGYGGETGSGGSLLSLFRGSRSKPPGGAGLPDFGIPVPSGNTLTPIAHRALEIAHAEAIHLGHDYIGTEHVLLGVLEMAKGALAAVLKNSQVDPKTVRLEIHRLVMTSPTHSSITALPFTPRARKALQFAGHEADALKHPSIGAEDILLGLLVAGGVAERALRNLGIHFEQIRKEIARASARS
jgi:hypothetical protein